MTGQTDRRTDGCHTITLSFPLDTAVKTSISVLRVVKYETKPLNVSTYLNAKNVTNAAARQTMLRMQPKYVISDKLNSCAFDT